MEKIILLPQLIEKIERLTVILFDKEYFSYPEDAIAYTDAIYDFIYTIPGNLRRRTKHPRYGLYYCRYKANTQTTYYITFDVIQGYYFIKNIISNHTKEYPLYIRGR